MALIEAEGAQAPAMTRLATELGCGLVALYSHVPSTQALLDGVAAAVVSGSEPTGGAAPAPDAEWPAWLRVQARAAWRTAMIHPRCSIAVASWPAATAAQLRAAEQLLGTLLAAGFAGPDAVRIMRALAAFLVGCLVRKVGVAPSLRADSADAAEITRPVLRAASFPHLTGLSAELAAANAEDAPDADFEFGLELLLRGMTALLAAQPPGS